MLVWYPCCAVVEEVEFQWQTLHGGLELSHHDGEILIDARMTTQIVFQIVAEDVEVDDHIVLTFQPFQPTMFLELGHLFLGGKGDGAHVYVDGTLYASAAALFHSAPVLEGVADKGIGRYGGYGHVPVLHLHRGEGHFYHGTVSTVLGHGNPITGAKHVVGRKLHTCHQPHYHVLEDKHQYGGRSTEGCEDVTGVLVDKYADDNY